MPKEPPDAFTSTMMSVLTVNLALILNLHRKGLLNKDDFAAELDKLAKQFADDHNDPAAAELTRRVADTIRINS